MTRWRKPVLSTSSPTSWGKGDVFCVLRHLQGVLQEAVTERKGGYQEAGCIGANLSHVCLGRNYRSLDEVDNPGKATPSGKPPPIMDIWRIQGEQCAL